MNLMKRFLPFFRPYVRHGAAISLVLLLTTAVTVGTPYFYKELVDDGIEKGNVPYVTAMLLAIVGAMVAQELLYLAQKQLTLTVREKVFSKLRIDLIEHLLRLPQSFYAETHKGRLLSRITSDVDAVQNLLLEKYIYFAQNLLVGLSIFVVVGTLNATMVLVAGLFLPLLFLLFLVFRRRIGATSKEAQEKQEALVERLQEDLAMVKAIQAFSVLRERLGKTHAVVRDAERARKRVNVQYSLASTATALINMLGVVVIWGIGGVAVVEGRMSLGTLIAVSFYLNLVVNMFFNVYYTVIGFQASLPSVRRIFEVLDASPDIADAADARPAPPLREAVAFHRVTFAYAGGKRVFEEVSLRLRKGELVGVVGDSGQGKTTFVNLLMRFYDPAKGSITWDERDLRSIRLDSLRSRAVNVPQEDYLFNATVRENIMLGRTADAAKFEQACRLSGVDSFVASLERGYDSDIGEAGMRLSSGQRKRISIARALLDDPDVLLLDEATSVLDEATERELLQAAKELSRSRLVVLVTHKLSNLQEADKLLHVDAGSITVYGSFDEYRKKVLLAARAE